MKIKENHKISKDIIEHQRISADPACLGQGVLIPRYPLSHPHPYPLSHNPRGEVYLSPTPLHRVLWKSSGLLTPWKKCKNLLFLYGFLNLDISEMANVTYM